MRTGSACAASASRPRARLAIFFAMLALALLALCAPAAPGASAAPLPTPNPTATADAGDAPLVTVAALNRGLVRTGEPLSVSVVAENPSDAELEPTTAGVSVGTAPITDPAILDGWLANTTDLETAVIDRQPVPAIAAGESVAITSSIAAETPGWAGLAPGVYPIEAAVGASEPARGAIVLLDTAAPPATAPVGIVVPITAGPRTTGLLSAEELVSLTAADGRLTQLVDGVSGSAAVLAIDPAIVASIRVLGTAAPASSTQWLARLEALPNTRFALQFADADVATQVHAGLSGLLEPRGLAYAVDPADVAEDTATPTPAPTGAPATPSPAPTGEPDDGGEPVLPDLAELTEIPGARSGVFWPAEGHADDGVVQTLAAWAEASGDTPDPLTLLASDAAERDTVTAAGTVGDADVLVYDSAASAALTAAAEPGDTSRAEALSTLSAHLALATTRASGPVLLAVDRLDEASAFGLQTALGGVSGYLGTAPLGWDELRAAEATPTRALAPAPAEHVEALQRLLVGEERLEVFSAVIDEPSLMLEPERTAILQLIGAGWFDDEEWPAAMADHAEQTQATLTAVELQPPSTIQLISPEAGLQFFVRNDLPWAANVVLVAVPDNLRLDVERTTVVRAEPGVNTRVQVPVRARVGSGEVDISLRLLSPTSEQVGPERVAEVQVRAEWEAIGIVVLSVLVVGFIATGVVRTVLRRRRAKRAEETSG
ncbi:DUF6049 family protein [Microbacterium limosum]|uniref:DUF6049 family protein n=1 Tax=Microbacterium limosum TaxID=3079935 RepID=A0AAU0MIN9_9MICO|nr:DUF6049 family protein [Microbacterium sp. Y20]WOQ69662.1 DUF6049 family protein [Microbacterium sp. Y20]